jgi:nucleotide-binding universal stress UspA family protein
MALQTITVPVDGSEFSTRAIPPAAAIARRADASVTLVAVATGEGDVDPLAAKVQAASKLVPGGVALEEEVLSNPDPVVVLMTRAEDATTVLCIASHDHLPASAAIRNSVGSKIIEHARHPLLVVGPDADESVLGADVLVALDGKHDPGPLLAAGAEWADTLHAPLRAVTVYEPVQADIRHPEHFSRTHGPPSDPQVYLEEVTKGLDMDGGRQVELVAIPDPVSIAVGLAEHLQSRPALVVVAGGQGAKHHPWPGVVRELVRCLREPVLVVRGEP